jgi:hypothetical protein
MKQDDDKSLILLSSVGGFKETPGMPVYMVRAEQDSALLYKMLIATVHQARSFRTDARIAVDFASIWDTNKCCLSLVCENNYDSRY